MTIIQKKVCLLGDFAVGKTSLVRRFVEGRFDDRYLSTIGVKISRRLVESAGISHSLLIWDLAGGSDFTNLLPTYLQGAAGALLVCDLTRPETLTSLALCHQKLKELNPQATFLLLANKQDLIAEKQITLENLRQFAESLQITYQLTSAKTGEGVEQAFGQWVYLAMGYG